MAVTAEPARAMASALPAEAEVKVVFTALAYEKSLAARYPEGLRIGIVSQAGDGASTSRGTQLVATMQKLSAATIQGLSIRPVAVEAASAAAVHDAVAANRINVLYLGPGLDRDLGAILADARRNKLLILTGEEQYVRAGAVLGVAVRGDKPKVMVNLGAAKAQGAEFDYRLLHLAEVIQ